MKRERKGDGRERGGGRICGERRKGCTSGEGWFG